LIEDDGQLVDNGVVNRTDDEAEDIIATELESGNSCVWKLVWPGLVVLCLVNEVPLD
jgi:hypothetical protein